MAGEDRCDAWALVDLAHDSIEAAIGSAATDVDATLDDLAAARLLLLTARLRMTYQPAPTG